MTRLLSAVLAFVGLLGAASSAQQSPVTAPIRLAYLYSDGNVSGTLKAYKTLMQERPDLRGRIALTFLTESMLADVKTDELTNANVLVLDVMNQQMLERFNDEKKVDLIMPLAAVLSCSNCTPPHCQTTRPIQTTQTGNVGPFAGPRGRCKPKSLPLLGMHSG